MNVAPQPQTLRPQRTDGGRVAVIGSGISGLSAAWLLSQSREVTLYESATWLGGHSNTVVVEGAGRPIPVDTGFIVYNEPCYPNLTALFSHLGVATKPAPMSFAVSLDGGRLEYSSASLNAVFGQRRNLLRPGFWRMVGDITRFYRDANAAVDGPQWQGATLGAFLDAGGYCAALRDHHVLPMCAAIWSASQDDVRQMPFSTFARFFLNHGLLDIRQRPAWRTVEGGSRVYVKRMRDTFRGRLRIASGVRRIARRADEVLVEEETGRHETYDDAVIATHADDALRLLVDADGEERATLGAFRYARNLAILHGDSGVMPKTRRVWSSWNFTADDTSAAANPSVTYWMNNLQSLDRGRPLFVTLNPRRQPLRDVHAQFQYSHPIFDQASLAAQPRLSALQGRRRTWFCGSYFGYGFHEDGLQSGLAVAEALGGLKRPWTVPDESGRIHLPARVAAGAAMAVAS